MSRPRIVFDPVLQAEVQLTFDDKGRLLVTFGAAEPSHTGAWGTVIYALRAAVVEVDS